MLYIIDIVGTCNLKCPSCPVGNFDGDDFVAQKRPKGFMEIGLFREILDKINRENPTDKAHIHLYNWGESLIHPEICEFLREISRAKLTVETSTNLNGELDLKNIVKAFDGQIVNFRVSMSGSSQDVYKRGHKGGNVSIVKSNLYRLRYYMDLYKRNLPVYVYYHVYRDNAGQELLDMIRLCNDLRIPLRTGWATLMPVEKMMTALNVPYEVQRPERMDISAADREVLARVVVPLEKMQAIGRLAHFTDCPLRSWQTVINFDGSVALCCGVYDPVFTVASSFLEIPQSEIQKLKYANQMCKTCMESAVAQIACAAPAEEWDAAGNAVFEKLGVGANVSTATGKTRIWM